MIAALVPIYKSTERFLLMPTMVSLQDNTFFLMEPTLLKWFNLFIEEQHSQYKRSQQEEANQNSSNIPPMSFINLDQYRFFKIYLAFYQEINMLKYNLECESDEQLQFKQTKLKEILQEYVVSNQEAFPDNLIYFILRQPNNSLQSHMTAQG